MSLQKPLSKRRGRQFSKMLFTGLAIGFTMISVFSQFKFYQILFGVSSAALISGVLETTRIASLFKFLHTKSTKTVAILTMGTYILTAGVSAWGAINSFTTEVIQKDRESRFNDTEQIHLIKTAYSKKIDGKLAVIEKEISRLQTAIAKYPKSTYWQNRMSQQVTACHELTIRREAFLNEQPKSEDTEKWIQANAAKLGLQIERPSREKDSFNSVTQALKELWGIEAGTAKKIIAIIVTLTVEAGILILAFLGVAERKNEGVTDVAGVTETVTAQLNDEHVAKFIEANKAHFKETGELLPMRKLTSNLRPVRKAFEGFDREELKKYFEA
ncbi:MAG: hypothetical protein PVH61_00160 [Candidatus Aminicenantes bacterium]|jgi:hypothetical protein